MNYIQIITELFQSNSIKELQKLINTDNNLQKYLNKLYMNNNMSYIQKCYHLIYNIKDIPICSHCKINYAKFDDELGCYKSTCSNKCNKLLKDSIISDNKEHIINDLYPNNNFINYELVDDYVIDFANGTTLYEILDFSHLCNKKFLEDKIKYKKLHSDNFKINIIFNFYEKLLTKKYIDKIENYNNEISNYVNSIIIYSNNKQKILTDTGWSEFDGLIKYNNRETIQININNINVNSTKEHLFYISKAKTKMAKDFDYVNNKYQDVYDVINVNKNNRFFVNNKILTHNCLICDEFAFLKPNIEEEFLNSVFPVISSSKTSQIIIVSTPHGNNNEYYRIWNKALMDIQMDSEDAIWTPIRIDWFDVPGRDEKWKKEQLATFNGSEKRFQQEYGCGFAGSVDTLVKSERIAELKNKFSDENFKIKPYFIQLHKDFPKTTIHMYKPPQPNRAYIVGADPSTGSDNDYQGMTVWDITNGLCPELVASFYENDVPPRLFAYIIAKTATLYNRAYVAMENNGNSFATLESLTGIFEYDNICHIGGNPKTSIAISSNANRKLDACLNFKDICENKYKDIKIYDGRLINEMEQYERRNKPGRAPEFGNFHGHDDLMASAIWALYILKSEFVEQYYDVKKYVNDKLGNTYPSIIFSSESQESINNDILNIMENMDAKFSNIMNNYESSYENLEENIEESQQELMNKFLFPSNDNFNSNSNLDKDDETFIAGFKT